MMRRRAIVPKRWAASGPLLYWQGHRGRSGPASCLVVTRILSPIHRRRARARRARSGGDASGGRVRCCGKLLHAFRRGWRREGREATFLPAGPQRPRIGVRGDVLELPAERKGTTKPLDHFVIALLQKRSRENALCKQYERHPEETQCGRDPIIKLGSANAFQEVQDWIYFVEREHGRECKNYDADEGRAQSWPQSPTAIESQRGRHDYAASSHDALCTQVWASCHAAAGTQHDCQTVGNLPDGILESAAEGCGESVQSVSRKDIARDDECALGLGGVEGLVELVACAVGLRPAIGPAGSCGGLCGCRSRLCTSCRSTEDEGHGFPDNVCDNAGVFASATAGGVRPRQAPAFSDQP
mmetsp:Transcript_109137/g.307690  ORF Transcript_109137/g.307690 Transcript_109137/m.307690 type:complete len:356 (-) Transcript_109137:680-1747(-)